MRVEETSCFDQLNTRYFGLLQQDGRELEIQGWILSTQLSHRERILILQWERSVCSELSIAHGSRSTLTPLGDLRASQSRKTYFRLLLALNTLFPAYDFSHLDPAAFCRVPGAYQLRRTLARRLGHLASSPELTALLWKPILSLLPASAGVYLIHDVASTHLPRAAPAAATSALPIPTDLAAHWSLTIFFDIPSARQIGVVHAGLHGRSAPPTPEAVQRFGAGFFDPPLLFAQSALRVEHELQSPTTAPGSPPDSPLYSEIGTSAPIQSGPASPEGMDIDL